MDEMKKIKAGIVGCGNISEIYLQNVKRFDSFYIVACADLDANLAKQRAEEFGIPKACTTEELLADSEIDLVINLTTPAVHSYIDLAALYSGITFYIEMNLAVSSD